MNRRLQQFLQAENISQSQFADTLQVARASVSHILAGRNKPGYDFLESLHLHYPELNFEWLITGKGRMYRENSLFPDETSSPAQIPDSRQTPQSEERQIARILVFYDDNTFEEFRPALRNAMP